MDLGTYRHMRYLLPGQDVDVIPKCVRSGRFTVVKWADMVSHCKWAGIHTVHAPAHVQHTMINLPTQPIHRCVEFKTRLPFIPHGHT